MNVLDVVIVALVVAGIIGGYRLGMVTRVASWVGMALGLFAAVRLLPWVLERVPRGGGLTSFALVVGVLLLLAFVGQGLGIWIGSTLRPVGDDGTVTVIDRVLGGLAGFVGTIVMVWLLLPLAAHTPGWVASLATNSALARQLDEHLPDPPDTMQALQGFVGDGFPRVFEALQPTPNLGPPPAASGLSPEVAGRVARSVVKVEGIACSRIQDGSGFVVADGLVVTNAHVVAGERTTEVQRDDGARLDADVVAFDSGRDLAVLRVRNLDRPALPIGSSASGERGGVFGHPGGEPLRIAPFEVARVIRAVGRDIYGTSRTEREVLELSAQLRPGDSGSALVDPTGTVIGVAFAIAPDRPNVAYALSTDELRAVLATPMRSGVSTGECIA
ncbi:MAG: MarP family serine protease [Acidimicrobiales bacterium]